MMKRVSAFALAAVAFSLIGCAHNNVVADGTTRTGTFYGDFGVTGSNNVVTVERWSKLDKLSVIGDANEIILERGVRVPTIEVFGSDNTISVPETLIVQMNQVGHRNRLVRRSVEATPAELPRYEPRPPVYDRVRISVERDDGTTETAEGDDEVQRLIREMEQEPIEIPPPPPYEEDTPAPAPAAEPTDPTTTAPGPAVK